MPDRQAVVHHGRKAEADDASQHPINVQPLDQGRKQEKVDTCRGTADEEIPRYLHLKRL